MELTQGTSRGGARGVEGQSSEVGGFRVRLENREDPDADAAHSEDVPRGAAALEGQGKTMAPGR